MNKDKDFQQKFIYPDVLNTKFTQTMIQWAKLNPSATVVFWYDGSLIAKEAIENTQHEIEQAQLALNSGSKQCIVLKNIRDLTLVKENDKIFSPLIPIYFRVDLVRMLVAYESLIEESKCVFVTADLDVIPIALKTSIKKGKNKLKSYGIIMTEGEYAHEKTGYIPYYENSFQMIYSNKNFLLALKEVMIDFSIGEAEKLLQSKENKNITVDTPLNSQFVYELYEQTFAVYHHRLGNATCLCLFKGKEGTVFLEYNSPQIKKFGNTLFLQVKKLADCGIILVGIAIDRDKGYKEGLVIERTINKDGEKEECLFVPRLKVIVPPSRFLENTNLLQNNL